MALTMVIKTLAIAEMTAEMPCPMDEKTEPIIDCLLFRVCVSCVRLDLVVR
jgi:hypothetical protein